MTDDRTDSRPAAGRWLTWAWLGIVAGSACQLQQRALWGGSGYAALGAAALVLVVFIALSRAAWTRSWPVLLAAGLLAFASVGLRSVQFAGQGLSPALEGRDIALTGVIAAMPQRSDGALRLRFEVESARWGREAVVLPPQLALGWYGGFAGDDARGQPPEVRAGERWQLTARLKAPHGSLNPFGFDYELFLWEQGLQATGYVRAGPKDPPARRLGVTGWHPVERARQSVRDAIDARVPDRKSAGLLAALVVGDQNAIDGIC